MPDLKLPQILEACQPARVLPALETFWGPLGPGRAPEVQATRLQPPICYWTVYRLGPAGQADARYLTLKCFFSGEAYDDYVEQLCAFYADRLDQPDQPRGGIALLPECNGVLWAFPFDPVMPGLYHSVDGAGVAEALQRPAGSPVLPEVRRYNPEISVIMAYRDSRRRRGRRRVIAFGKCAPEDRSGVQYVLMDRLWHSPAREEGRLLVAQPLAFRKQGGLLLQAPVPGRTIGGDRNRAIFLELARHAAVAAAAIQEVEAPFAPERPLDDLIEGRKQDLEEMALTAPALYQTLRLLIDHLEARARHSKPAPAVLNHGDFKWDQFLEQGGCFSLIDFELFCRSEPWLDVGYFCAYLAPPEHDDWRDGAAAEMLRTAFLDSYAAASGRDLDLARISLFEAAALAIRASVHVEMHQSGWEQRAGGLLELALDRLVDPAPKRLEFA